MTKKALAELLAKNQCSISMSLSDASVHISATSSLDDAMLLHELVAAMVNQANMSCPTIHELVEQEHMMLNGSTVDCHTQSEIRFIHMLVRPGSPLFVHSLQAQLDSLKHISPQDVVDWYAAHVRLHVPSHIFLQGPAVDAQRTTDIVDDIKKYFTVPVVPIPQERKTWKVLAEHPVKAHYFIENKSSTIYNIGAAVPVGYFSDDLVPLLIGMRCLGHGFESPVMKRVRIEEGLTYGIYSSISTSYGHSIWRVQATFATEHTQKGIRVSLETLHAFVNEATARRRGAFPTFKFQEKLKASKRDGSWQPMLDDKIIHMSKTSLCGEISVHMDSVADALYSENSRFLRQDVSVSEYKRQIMAVTPKQCVVAIHKYMHPDNYPWQELDVGSSTW